jgi:hypothetical protein
VSVAALENSAVSLLICFTLLWLLQYAEQYGLHAVHNRLHVAPVPIPQVPRVYIMQRDSQGCGKSIRGEG